MDEADSRVKSIILFDVASASPKSSIPILVDKNASRLGYMKRFLRMAICSSACRCAMKQTLEKHSLKLWDAATGLELGVIPGREAELFPQIWPFRWMAARWLSRRPRRQWLE